MRFIGVDVHLHSFCTACISDTLKITVIAVDAPYGLNLGLMDDPHYRDRLNPGLKGHYNKKVGEYERSRRGFALYNTPQKMEDT